MSEKTDQQEKNSQIAKGKLNDLDRAFKAFDKNDDGRISKDELKEVLGEAGVDFTEEQLDDFMKKIDTDGNGTIDYSEFCNMMKELIFVSLEKSSSIKTIFDAIDVNSDGKIQDTELQDALTQLIGDDVEIDEARDVIRAVDRDGDGHINFDEFVTMLHMLQLDQ